MVPQKILTANSGMVGKIIWEISGHSQHLIDRQWVILWKILVLLTAMGRFENNLGNKTLTGLTFGREFATSSLNISTSSGLIHLDDFEMRSSTRVDPERYVLSTNFKELLPSMAASIENFSGGSSVSLYMHGGQRLCETQGSSLPSALCTRASTWRNIAR